MQGSGQPEAYWSHACGSAEQDPTWHGTLIGNVIGMHGPSFCGHAKVPPEEVHSVLHRYWVKSEV
jgi:hypothetical protein